MPDYVPNTIVRVLKDVPLDDTYSDTIKFNSTGEQSGYFAGKAKYTFTEMTYQRVNNSVARPRGPLTVRVPMIADNLYDCNYIMFQNTNYGNKWFYAFIKQVNYINPENTEIVYEIDYMQTFMLDFQVNESFVEREHTNNDQRYANLQAEPVSAPQLWSNTQFEANPQFFGPPYYIRVWTSTDPSGQSVNGSLTDNIFSGLEYHEFTDAGGANALLNEYAATQKLENVVGINMAPYSMGSTGTTYSPSFSEPDSLNGYTPMNQKCYNYPYRYMIVSDNAGNTMELPYEGWCEWTVDENGNITVIKHRCTFDINYACAYNAAIILTPRDYGGHCYEQRNFDKQMIINDFPQCAWSGNAFANWLGTELPQRVMGILMNGLNNSNNVKNNPSLHSGTNSAAKVRFAESQAEGSTLGELASLGFDFISAHNNGGVLQGTVGDYSINMKLDRILFEFKDMCPPPEFTMKLDHFFNMFGYATNTVKIPNMEGRANFNYVKTRNANITGSVPVEGMAIIKAAFNNGIRLWHGDITRSLLTAPNPIVSHETNKEVKAK